MSLPVNWSYRTCAVVGNRYIWSVPEWGSSERRNLSWWIAAFRISSSSKNSVYAPQTRSIVISFDSGCAIQCVHPSWNRFVRWQRAKVSIPISPQIKSRWEAETPDLSSFRFSGNRYCAEWLKLTYSAMPRSLSNSILKIVVRVIHWDDQWNHWRLHLYVSYDFSLLILAG
jgi:hypothetical protein